MTVCPECFDGSHSHCIGQGCECECNEEAFLDPSLEDDLENFRELGGEG